MAYEISEGAAAGAFFLDPTTLGSMKVGIEKKKIIEVMTLLHTNLKDKTKIKLGASYDRYTTWFDPKKIDLPKDKAFGKNTDAKLTAVVHGCSAALGIRKFMKEEGDEWNGATVYVTGAAWDKDISFLKVSSSSGWADYNSSDLVIVKKKCYYGVSLKKKAKETSADPTMINKSFVKLMESDVKMETFVKDFWDARRDYFGGLAKSEMSKGALAVPEATIGGSSMTDAIAFFSQVWNPFGKKWVNLIDLKGKGKLNLTNGDTYTAKDAIGKRYDHRKIAKNANGFIYDSEGGPNGKGGWIVGGSEEDYKKNKAVRLLFGYKLDGDPAQESPEATWTMRSSINKKVGNIEGGANNILKKIQEIAEDKKVNGVNFAETIGEYLISAVLKTELQGLTKTATDNLKKGYHFGFALITALGAVKTTGKGDKKVTKITAAGSTALVKTNPTMQQTISNLADSLKKGLWKIEVAKNPTKADNEKQKKNKEESAPAKIFFDIGVTKDSKYIAALNLNIRYKGSFISSPQFQGGMSDAFIKLLETESKTIENEFTLACG